MNLTRRLEELEERARRRPAASSSRPDARERMRSHLDRVAELRRGGASVEDNAELAAVGAAVRRLRDRGEGGR